MMVVNSKLQRTWKEGTISVFAWRDWGKQQKTPIWVVNVQMSPEYKSEMLLHDPILLFNTHSTGPININHKRNPLP
jgi:hypothetical protein